MKILRSTLSLSLLLSSVLGAAVVSANEVALPQLIFARPQRQPGSGVPDNLDTAISRGECPQLEALVPTEIPLVEIEPGRYKEGPRLTWGLTASEAPVIWFRVNQSVPNAHFEMVLTAEDGSVVDTYQKTLSATDRLFAMPLSADSLMDKDVFYSFVGSMEIDCEVIEGVAPQRLPLSSGGHIQRVDLPASATDVEDSKVLALAYAEAGLWFDAFNAIAELHQIDPADAWVSEALAELMQKMEPDIFL